MIGFKVVLLLISFVFGVNTFKYGLSKTWINAYRRHFGTRYITNKENHISDENCQLVKYDCKNDFIIIKQITLPKNKNPYLFDDLLQQKKYIHNDSIYSMDSNMVINTFMETENTKYHPQSIRNNNVITWAS